MISRDREQVAKGSWRWAAQVAEAIAWVTSALAFLVVSAAGLPGSRYRLGIALCVLLAGWVVGFFHLVLPRTHHTPPIVGGSVLVALGLTTGLYSILHGFVPTSQLLFVPMIVIVSLVGNYPATLFAAATAVAGYLTVAELSEASPSLPVLYLNCVVFALSATVAGLLARELRQHYRAEQAEHQVATAVRHRLQAVLDAVDEAIIFRTKEGLLRFVNERAIEIFGLDRGEFLGGPAVQLLRTIARQTEDPEGFMEVYQDLRDDPERELRVEIEQIIPTRRELRVYSGPTFDEGGGLVGRIDVFTDITQTVRHAAEIERLYEEARKTAESFQRALLPESVPSLPRVSLVAHYVAASAPRAVCGDFYDFVPLSDGRVALVIGDVCGLGPAAANDAALSRYSLRSFAGEESDPAALLERMNSHVFMQSRAERFVRMLVAVLDPERATLTYANAGHVPPILYRARSADAEWLSQGGMVLGVELDTDYKAGHIDLEPGDMLVCYTDGVTEAPRRGIPFGQAKLGDLVRDYGVGTPGELVQAIRRSVDSWTDGTLRDDLALLVCQVVPDAMVGEPVRELVLPNETSRIAEIRDFVAVFLGDLRVPVDVSFEILLAVSEAAANAARYGRNPDGRSEVRVRCVLEGTSLTVTVADDGPGFDAASGVTAELPERFASGGRGMFLMQELMDDVVVDSTPAGTTVTLTRAVVGLPGAAGPA
ncbi:MAG: phosphoserine phosphatase RsbU/P [Actinomycetota bacterium]|nr:phosphoserine phosphatase RsbU/P [Actinomycetota bacterium]